MTPQERRERRDRSEAMRRRFARAVGRVIRARRGTQTLAALATASGVSPTKLGRVERGRAMVDAWELHNIIAALGARPSDFHAAIDHEVARDLAFSAVGDGA